jgi:hypothetical protein
VELVAKSWKDLATLLTQRILVANSSGMWVSQTKKPTASISEPGPEQKKEPHHLN